MIVRRLRGMVSRLRRCHWLTWCAMLLASAVLLLIVVPGDWVDGRRPCATEWEDRVRALYIAMSDNYHATRKPDHHAAFATYEHGWPWPCLGRYLLFEHGPTGHRPDRVRSEAKIGFLSQFRHWGGPTYHNVSWSNYDNWPLTADDWLLDPVSLLLDLAAVAAIVAAVGAAVEWRVRHSAGWFRFQLADLLAATACVCALLGYYVYHDRVQQVEACDGARTPAPGFLVHNRSMTLGQRYTGPDWLRKIIGNKYLIPLLHHVEAASIYARGNWRGAYAELPKLPYLQRFRARNALPLAALPILKRCRGLEELRLPRMNEQPPKHLPDDCNPILGPEHLPVLEMLLLSTIELEGNAIRAEHIEVVASFPTIETIKLDRVSATQEEIEAIQARHPGIEIHVAPDVSTFLSP